MKPHLMYRDRDFTPDPPPAAALDRELERDLELDVVFRTMAGSDDFRFQIARRAILTAPRESRETMLYRQEILRDCLRNPERIQELYDLAVDAVEGPKRQWLGLHPSRHPGGVLYDAVRLLEASMNRLATLRRIAEKHRHAVHSEGLANFFAMLRRELAADYLAQVRDCLKQLKFRNGILLSARLGEGNQSDAYVLHPPPAPHRPWLPRFLNRHGPAYTFRIAERDAAGARILEEIRSRAINAAADAAARSAEHVLNFFSTLRTELAFYLGAVRLYRRLEAKGIPVCFPKPEPAETGKFTAAGLRDPALALTLDGPVIGNDVNADGKSLVVVTGANQGGKSTFLRAAGAAQLLMQAGMFVPAESFQSAVCSGLFTHWKREEDNAMESGKFDEELRRMSRIVDALAPHAMVLLNESFAATNEREGSEIAAQIVRAFLEHGVRVFFVTHFYEFAHAFWQKRRADSLFLRAERNAGGRRTFRILPGKPLRTSFAQDLYRRIFTPADKPLSDSPKQTCETPNPPAETPKSP